MSLSEIIQDYRTNPDHRTDGKSYREHKQHELDWFSQLMPREAIEKAAMSVDSRGKRHGHQRRIKNKALKQATKALLTVARKLQKCVTFDELQKAVEAVQSKVNGTGPLYAYDVALRIGANMGLLPKKVYLHAGTRKGAAKLGVDTRSGTVDVKTLPPEFRGVPELEIEDILCIYKGNFR